MRYVLFILLFLPSNDLDDFVILQFCLEGSRIYDCIVPRMRKWCIILLNFASFLM